MKRPVWVRPETVLALHEQLLATFGGSAGLRDLAMLDSALARPQNRFAYGQPTLFELSANYAFGLFRNHPFVDGNERTAFAVSVLFLERNSYSFHAPEADAVVQMLGLAAGELEEAGYASWLQAHSRRRPRRT